MTIRLGRGPCFISTGRTVEVLQAAAADDSAWDSLSGGTVTSGFSCGPADTGYPHYTGYDTATWMRFPAVPSLLGRQIQEARIALTPDSTTVNLPPCKVRGDASGASPADITTGVQFTGRTRSTAVVQVPDLSHYHSEPSRFWSPDLTPIIDELLSRFPTLTALAFFYESTAETSQQFTAYSYFGSAAKAPRLYLTFT